MSRHHLHRRHLLALLAAVICVTVAATPAHDVQRRISAIASPYRFGAVGWMTKQWLVPRRSGTGPEDVTPSRYVLRYLELVAEIDALEREREMVWARSPDASSTNRQERTAVTQTLDALRQEQADMRPHVERILARQIRETLDELGILNPANPWMTLQVRFPPIAFRLERPPQLLVVSPRERIESVQEIMLRQDLDITTALSIEEQVEALGLSALVTEIGGFGGTYPTFVAETSSLRWTIETATEEWLHQYLAFTPLGALYVLDVLGLRPDYEIARMNETVAGLASQEIAREVLLRYYADDGPALVLMTDEAFDYVAFMRETRVQVDRLLEAGHIERAEAYMEARRQELARQGYAIRKLNQAYFAFYGTYTYGPAAVDPLYEEIKLLRAHSRSLEAFVNQAAKLQSRDELRNLLQLPPPMEVRQEQPSIQACSTA